ncbi:MAG: hypothetical protein LC745_11765 [Planctomycetia bacterium]|nr:hypothetical protein [Planctomycetia bacterium]
MRRWTLAVGAALLMNGWLLSTQGHAQRWGATSSGRVGPDGSSGSGLLRPYGPRDVRTSAAQKPQSYSRSSPTPSPADDRSRAAVFAKGVRDYYPDARSNQSANRNVVDTRTLCNPGRRALLRR